jgi:hypothetical protein
MARMSHYEFDFFVSYAHVDNEPIYPAEIGWVSVLIENCRPSALVGQNELIA